jgi:hypothetical protein
MLKPRAKKVIGALLIAAATFVALSILPVHPPSPILPLTAFARSQRAVLRSR